MKVKQRDKLIMTFLGWGVAFLVFFPILWMAITSFKTEIDAVVAAAPVPPDAREATPRSTSG